MVATGKGTHPCGARAPGAQACSLAIPGGCARFASLPAAGRRGLSALVPFACATRKGRSLRSLPASRVPPLRAASLRALRARPPRLRLRGCGVGGSLPSLRGGPAALSAAPAAGWRVRFRVRLLLGVRCGFFFLCSRGFSRRLRAGRPSLAPVRRVRPVRRVLALAVARVLALVLRRRGRGRVLVLRSRCRVRVGVVGLGRLPGRGFPARRRGRPSLVRLCAGRGAGSPCCSLAGGAPPLLVLPLRLASLGAGWSPWRSLFLPSPAWRAARRRSRRRRFALLFPRRRRSRRRRWWSLAGRGAAGAGCVAALLASSPCVAPRRASRRCSAPALAGSACPRCALAGRVGWCCCRPLGWPRPRGRRAVRPARSGGRSRRRPGACRSARPCRSPRRAPLPRARAHFFSRPLSRAFSRRE